MSSYLHFDLLENVNLDMRETSFKIFTFLSYLQIFSQILFLIQIPFVLIFIPSLFILQPLKINSNESENISNSLIPLGVYEAILKKTKIQTCTCTQTHECTHNFQSYKEVQCSKTSIPNINLSENLRQPSSLCFPSIASGMTTNKKA